MKVTLSILLVALYLPAFTQSSDCSQFRTGKFYTDTPTLGRTFINRSDSLQIEKNDSVGYHYVLEVNWVDSCEYTLRLLENKSTDPKFSPPSQQFFMRVKVTEINDSSYKTESNLNGGKYLYQGVITKLED